MVMALGLDGFNELLEINEFKDFLVTMDPTEAMVQIELSEPDLLVVTYKMEFFTYTSLGLMVLGYGLVISLS